MDLAEAIAALPAHLAEAFAALCAEQIVPELPVRVRGMPAADYGLRPEPTDYSRAAIAGAVLVAQNVVWRERYPLKSRPSFSDFPAFLAWDNERTHAAKDAADAAMAAEVARQLDWLSAHVAPVETV